MSNVRNIINKTMFEILENKEKLKISKDWILENLDEFELYQKNNNACSVLFYIVIYNKEKKLGFTKDDILSILDKFNLKQQDADKNNVLMRIIIHNTYQNLGFNKKDILGILDKFDLNQKNNVKSIYDFIKNIKIYGFNEFNKDEVALLVSKMDIEMKNRSRENILIKELKNGLIFDSEELVQKILNTENKEIVDCVYKHINQISWKEHELLLFLKKNKLELINNVFL